MCAAGAVHVLWGSRKLWGSWACMFWGVCVRVRRTVCVHVLWGHVLRGLCACVFWQRVCTCRRGHVCSEWLWPVTAQGPWLWQGMAGSRRSSLGGLYVAGKVLAVCGRVRGWKRDGPADEHGSRLCRGELGAPKLQL